MERFDYAVHLADAEEGGFVVTCRDLPHLVTQGDDLAHALSEAADAMDEVFAAYMQGGIGLPAPTKARKAERLVAPPAGTIAKVALYVAMREAGITQVQLAKNEFLAALERDKSGSDTKLALAALTKRVAAKREDFESFMSKVPNVPPLQGDEIQKKDQQGMT